MSRGLPVAVAKSLSAVEQILPAGDARGLSISEIYAQLQDPVFSRGTLGIALRWLEDDGRVASHLAPGPSDHPTRFFKKPNSA